MDKIRGIVENITAPVNVGKTRPYVKRTLVLHTWKTDPYSGETTYESWPSFEFSGDKAALLDNLRQGAAVEVQYAVVGKRVTKADGTVAYFNYVRGIAVAELRRQARQGQPEARGGQRPQQQQPQQWQDDGQKWGGW